MALVDEPQEGRKVGLVEDSVCHGPLLLVEDIQRGARHLPYGRLCKVIEPGKDVVLLDLCGPARVGPTAVEVRIEASHSQAHHQGNFVVCATVDVHHILLNPLLADLEGNIVLMPVTGLEKNHLSVLLSCCMVFVLRETFWV